MRRLHPAFGQPVAVPAVLVPGDDRVERRRELVGQRHAVAVGRIEHREHVLGSVPATAAVGVGVGRQVEVGPEVVRRVAVLQVAVVVGIAADHHLVLPVVGEPVRPVRGGRRVEVDQTPVDVLLPTAFPPGAAAGVTGRRQVDAHAVRHRGVALEEHVVGLELAGELRRRVARRQDRAGQNGQRQPAPRPPGCRPRASPRSRGSVGIVVDVAPHRSPPADPEAPAGRAGLFGRRKLARQPSGARASVSRIRVAAQSPAAGLPLN